MMSQLVYAEIIPQFRPFIFLLLAIGLLAFALGARLAARPHLPSALLRPVNSLTGWLHISSAQLLLLVFAPCLGLLAALAAGDVLQAINVPVYLLAWFLSVACVLVGASRSSQGAEPTIDRREVAVVVALFLLAFLLRAWSIGTLPTTLSGDEGSAGLAAVEFAHGRSTNILTIDWFSFPSLYFAIQSFGILLLGQTVAGLRIVSALAGALTVVAVYGLARVLFNRMTAVFAAILLAAFHYHIHFSRIGLNNIWDGLFGALIMAGLWYGWKHERRIGFLVCGLALGLAQYFYVSIRVFPILLLIWAFFALLSNRKKFKRCLPDLSLAAFIAFVVVIPLIFFFARHTNEFNAPLQRVTIFDGWLDQMVLQEQQPAIKIIWDQVLNTALGFTHLPLRHWYNPGVPLLLPGSAALFILGVLWALTNMNLRYLLLLLPLLSMVILGGLSQDAPASQRYVIAVPFVAVLVALPLARLTQWLQENWPHSRRVILAGAAVIVIWLSATDLHYYFFDVYDEYVLGGYNTYLATEIAYYLEDQDPPPYVYFFGFPRMGYFSLSTIPYIAADVQAEDVLTPLTEPPLLHITGPTDFIFLPERLNERQYVEQKYPGGTYSEYLDENNGLLFAVYTYSPQIGAGSDSQ
ncbi:MAG: glycosyltransferase family 39 protein [Candidatus Promineifilaceae bacterium]